MGIQNSKFKIQNLAQKIVLLLILVVAAFMRLYRIQDYMTFLGDEGRDVLVVYNILHGHLTLLGPTSSVGGFFLGPIYYYFMAPFLWLFNYNPVGPAVMVAIFGIATVWLIYVVGKDFFNTKVGLITALIYAISPLVIVYSRSSWNPNPLPFFSLLTLYLVYKALKKNSLKLLFAAGVLFGIAMQLHYLAIFLGIVILVYVLLSVLHQTKTFKVISKLFYNYFAIFLGFIIGWSPFLAFEVRHGFLDFKSIITFVLFSGKTGASPNYFTTIYDVFFRLFGRLVFYFPTPDFRNYFTHTQVLVWQVFVLLFALFACVVILSRLYKAYKHKSEDFNKYLLLTIWLVVGILLFGFYKKEIYDYYFAFLFPLPFLLIAQSLDFLKNIKFFKIGIILASVLFFIIVGLNLDGIPFQYQPNRQLNQMRSIADFVFTRTDAKPFNFALISSGNSDYAYRYFFNIWSAGKQPVTIETTQDDPQRKSVTDQLLVVCESPLPCEPLGNSLWEIAGFGRADIAGHWNVSVVEVYKLIHYKGK
ncbi:MAG TPA: glycosyltransferase family 39 protein [Patescibacteria group bacterium]|jgi:4-amino-4-deoxy-L-arabinose transferase-like glycosyltransferase|nr:glycosyltransferase family 39 protein [Patescibacteria group bacterium]